MRVSGPFSLPFFLLQFYNDLCKEESEKYQRDLQVWEDAMIKQNKLHLVRKSHLPKPKRVSHRSR